MFLLPIILSNFFSIGVDDIYVIVQAVDNLSQDEKKLPANERVAKAMKHAGVSITVTSVTDMAALLISSTTVSIHDYLHKKHITTNNFVNGIGNCWKVSITVYVCHRLPY